MGMAKDLMLGDIRKTAIAKEILCDASVLAKCPVHEDCTFIIDDLEQGIEYAHWLARKKRIPAKFSSLEDLIHYLELAFAEYGAIECSSCGG